MLVARAPKCYVCKKNIDKADTLTFIHYKQKYYHNNCFDSMKRSKSNKELVKKKNDKTIAINNVDFDQYVDYFYHLTETEQPRQFIEKQLKKLVKEGFKLEGLKLTATYYTDILNKPFNKKAGINILAYHYKKAEHFYSVQARNSSYDLPEISDQIIYIKVEDSGREVRKQNRVKLEDIGGL